MGKYTLFTDCVVRRLGSTLFTGMAACDTECPLKRARVSTAEVRSAGFDAYMLANMPRDVRRRIGLYACVLHRLDVGWRRINFDIVMISRAAGNYPLADANRRAFLVNRTMGHGASGMIAGVLDDLERLHGIDSSIRWEVRDVFGMPAGEEGGTVLVGRGWQAHLSVATSSAWDRCPCCDEYGPWYRVYDHPGVEMAENDARFVNPRSLPDNVHPEGLIIRECAHCCQIEEGSPPFWT